MSSSEKNKGLDPQKQKTISESTITDALSINILEGILLRSNRFQPHLKTEDRGINKDGFVTAFNKKRVPIGDLDLQVKTLGTRSKKYPCPTALAEFAENCSANPFLFVCVDQKKEVAYWKQLSTDMPEYRPGQATFTITFTEEDLIDKTFAFSSIWSALAAQRAGLPNEIKTLKAELLTEVEPALRAKLQKFIGTVNSELDTNWRQIKTRLFPGLWQFGILLVDYDSQNDSWVLQNYCIPEGSNAPLIMAGPEILPDSHDDKWGRSLFDLRFTRRFNPIEDGIDFVKSIVDKILSQSNMAFSSDAGQKQKNFFVSYSDACLIERIFAVCKTFPQFNAAVKGNLVNLEILLPLLEDFDISIMNLTKGDMQDCQILLESSLVACLKLLKTATTVKNPYEGEGCPLAMYEGQNQSAITKNLKYILKIIVPEYQQLLKSNHLQFLGEHLFDQRLMVVFAIDRRSNGTIAYDEYFVEYLGTGSRVKIVDATDIDTSIFFKTHEISLKGMTHRVHYFTHRAAPTQLFTYSPLAEIMFSMLKQDIKHYFDDRLKWARSSNI